MLASINSAPHLFTTFGTEWRYRRSIGIGRNSDMTNIVHRDFTERKPLPAPNSDFYQLVELLNADELALVKKVRAYMETEVAPIINKYWSDDQFPFELLPSFKELNIGGLGYEGYGCAGGSQKQFGFVAMELARIDALMCPFWCVHSGLAMGSIFLYGSA